MSFVSFRDFGHSLHRCYRTGRRGPRESSHSPFLLETFMDRSTSQPEFIFTCCAFVCLYLSLSLTQFAEDLLNEITTTTTTTKRRQTVRRPLSVCLRQRRERREERGRENLNDNDYFSGQTKKRARANTYCIIDGLVQTTTNDTGLHKLARWLTNRQTDRQEYKGKKEFLGNPSLSQQIDSPFHLSLACCVEGKNRQGGKFA
mmetsp:Transcript_48138/g.95016  ORF Transcript_48138/g.95016 Transcript_48138/m.95016 type:complete len:202 (-) Transcript_48138:1386-1991(-)